MILCNCCRSTHHVRSEFNFEKGAEERKPRKLRVKSGKPRTRNSNDVQETSPFGAESEKSIPVVVNPIVDESNQILEVNEVPKKELNYLPNETLQKGLNYLSTEVPKKELYPSSNEPFENTLNPSSNESTQKESNSSFNEPPKDQSERFPNATPKKENPLINKFSNYPTIYRPVIDRILKSD